MVEPSPLSYEIDVAPQSALQLLAQLGSLLGTVLIVVRVAMNQLERLPTRSAKASRSDVILRVFVVA